MTLKYDENRHCWVNEDGLSIEEQEQERNQQFSIEELEELGIVEDASQLNKSKPKTTTALSELDSFMGYDTRKSGLAYEKLNAWDTIVDTAKAVGTEALHIFQPNNDVLGYHESTYVERTRFAENAKYLYRYGVGTLGFGKFGAWLKTVQNAGKLGKVANKLGTFLNPEFYKGKNKFIKTLTAGVDNLGADIVASSLLRRREDEEGNLFDIFGDNAPDWIKAMQSNEEDNQIIDTLKGLSTDIPLGIITAPIFSTAFEGLAKAFGKLKGQNLNKQQAEAIIETAAKDVDDIVEKTTLIQKVDEAIAKAQETNVEDIERYLQDSDFVNRDNVNDVMFIYNARIKNQPIELKEGGELDYKIDNWKDIANLTPEDVKRVTKGDGVELMNQTVKDVWTERGWLREGQDLITKTEQKNGTKITVNKQASDQIVKNYKDKWQIDNNIKVEWAEGKISGADGNTSATKYLGKTSKNQQIAIDKKKLQIKQLEDKIVYEEGGNDEVMETLNVLKEQLRIAKEELKQLEATATKRNLKPNILIQINKNSDNPYAVLRSELEHARDIAKREVPNQNEKHFNRYKGINESEMSLEYVKKKADKRNKAELVEELFSDEPTTKFDDFVNNKETSETTIGKLFDDNFYKETGIIDNIADIKISKITDEALSKEQGKGYKTTAELVLNENNDIIGIRINPNVSAEELERNILHEIRHLQQDSKIVDEAEKLSKQLNTEENIDKYLDLEAEKDAENWANEILNKKKEYHNGKSTSKTDEVFNNNIKNTSSINGTQSAGDGEIHIQSTPTKGIDNRPLTTTDRLKSTNGDLNEVDKIIDETINADVELSGFNWETLAKDAEELYRKLQKTCGKNLQSFKKAFAEGNIDLVNYMTRKALAAERFISDLSEQAKQMMNNGEDITEIMGVIDYLVDYCHNLGSAYGRGLNEQKFKNKAHSFFTLTTLEKQGLNSLVDLLKTDLTSLNFTQSIKENKEIIYEKIKNYFEGELWNILMTDQKFTKEFDKAITKVIKEKKPEAIEQALDNLNRQLQKDRLEHILKYSTSQEALAKSLRYQKNVGTYYINNLLSSPETHAKNIFSGVINTVTFPMQKIVGGFISDIFHIGDSTPISKEGFYTYQCLAMGEMWKEAWKLAKQCFEYGDGKMINLGKATVENTEKAFLDFKSFDEIKQNKNFGDVAANIFTLSCRIMGATDEFITQLNYRAVTRAKSMIEAEQGANLLGLQGDERAKYLREVTEDLFNKGFNLEGQPLDLEAFAEARDVVLQGSLDGKYYNPATKKREQVREQTTLMSVAAKIQDLASSNPIMKIFFPFVRTNTNIAQMNLNHNGIYQAIASLVSPEHKELLLSDTREGIRIRGQIGMGMLSACTAMGVVMQGDITGAEPADPKTRAALYKAGWQPYSIKIGDKWISYQGYEPFQSILGFTADCFNLVQAYDTVQTNEDNINTFIRLGTKAFFNNFIDKTSFRDSVGHLSELWEAIDEEDDKKVEQLLARQTRGFVPLVSGLNWVSTHFGESYPTKPQGYMESVFNRCFNEGLGDYRRNIFGERQDIYYHIISKSRPTQTTIEDEELLRLAQQGWSLSELQSKERKTSIDYKDYKGNNKRSLYDLILETLSEITLEDKTLREAMGELIESEEYQRMLDGIDIEEQGTKYTKVNSLKALYKRYKDAAKEQVIKEYGEYYYNKKGNNIAEEYKLLREAQEAKLLEAEIEEDIENIRSF